MSIETININNYNRTGYTLIELSIVLLILSTLSAVATMRLGHVLENTRIGAAETDLSVLREGFMGSATAPGYLADVGSLPGFSPAYLRVHNLLNRTNVVGRGGVRLDAVPAQAGYASFLCFTNWNAETGRGWHGPYVRVNTPVKNLDPARAGLFPAPSDRRTGGDPTFAERGFFPLVRGETMSFFAYGFVGEQAVADPWGNPYVLQIPPSEAFENPSEARRFHFARLVSAGPDGAIQTPCFGAGSWTDEDRRAVRLAGRLPDGSAESRGDDIVLFLDRSDTYDRDE